MIPELTADVLAEFISLPGGRLQVGSTQAEIDGAADYWEPRVDYDAATLRLWFSKETPAHTESVDPIHVMRFPLANGLATQLLGTRAPGIFDHPFIVPTAYDADKAADLISRKSGILFRLPSEAEWEWAARADTRNEFPWGADFNASLCNTVESGHGTTTSVASHPGGKSPFGLEDMAGNVEEWTADSYAPYPGGSYVVDDIARQSARAVSYRITRGGSHEAHGDLARIARRHGWIAGHQAFGIRLVVDGKYVRRAEDAMAALLSACVR